MSFLSERKNEIIEQSYKNACCRRAMLNGILFSKGYIFEGKINIKIENTELAEYIANLISDIFMKDADISNSKSGGRCKLVSFSSPAAERYISFLVGGGEYFSEKCPLCKSAFLRGVFLSSGRITDPKKQYRLEFAPLSNHDKLTEIFSDLGLNFSLTQRRSEKILYSSNSTVVEDFFAAAGMNSTVFTLMNSKIENDFKNSANRIRNCETNNILKTVSASARCVRAIESLEKANLLSTLPDELELTARKRLEFRDYSLARLAAEFTPPISKPGLSHRLNKIVEIAENLIHEKID
jgi:DNA-binding transcriptional regulator WhiA